MKIIMERFYGSEMGKMNNSEILQIYLDDRTIRTCVECQFSKIKNKEWMEDFYNDLIITILEYDNEKLNSVHNDKHFNAWLTRIIINNLYSTTSEYYRRYVRYGQKSELLTTDMEENLFDDDRYTD